MIKDQKRMPAGKYPSWIAMGSVMEFWPTGSYAEFMPHGAMRERLAKQWATTGRYIEQAQLRYERQQAS